MHLSENFSVLLAITAGRLPLLFRASFDILEHILQAL